MNNNLSDNDDEAEDEIAYTTEHDDDAPDSSANSVAYRSRTTSNHHHVQHHHETDSSVTTTTTTIMHHQHHRPRLEALRSRLQRETSNKNNNNSRSQSDDIQITNTTTTTTTTTIGKKSAQTPSTPNPQSSKDFPKKHEQEQQRSIEQLRQTLATISIPEQQQPPDIILTDSYGRFHNYLRLSLTERCNLRCTYCMPEAGVPLQPPSHLLSTPELLRLATHFRNRGVTKFRLTGGEPTLRSDLLDIVKGLNALRPERIGMTTNGIVLGSNSSSHPNGTSSSSLLSQLVQAGLNSLNISLDTMKPEKFAKLTRRPAPYLDRVWTCLDRAMDLVHASSSSSSLVVKLNCVVMRGTNEDEIADFIQLTERYPGLQVRFIEYMPFSENGWNWEKCIPYRELLADHHLSNLIPIPSDDPHDTTKWFTTTSHSSTPNGRTETPKIGFITSMSHHFCGTCNRLRLTADGKIKVCLFDNAEISLRDAIRTGFTDAELDKIIYSAVSRKKAALGGHKNPADIMKDADNNRPMTLIGG
jgi:cyclic pyranopterin phosphate synthase